MDKFQVAFTVCEPGNIARGTTCSAIPESTWREEGA